MPSVFPLDGPCTQLCCLSSCFLPLTFALIDIWPTNGNQQLVTNMFTKTYFYYYFWLCMLKPIYLVYNLCNWLLCNCTISCYVFYLFFSHQTRKHQIFQSEMTTAVRKQQQSRRVQRVPFRWGSHSSDACYDIISVWDLYSSSPQQHVTKHQPQKEKSCEREARKSLKWRQCLIVWREMSLTTSCWS